MDTQHIISRYGAPTVCRAASNRISGDQSTLRVLGVSDCESLVGVFNVMSAAHALLSPLEQALYAPALSELEQLALIEQALVRQGLCRR